MMVWTNVFCLIIVIIDYCDNWIALSVIRHLAVVMLFSHCSVNPNLWSVSQHKRVISQLPEVVNFDPMRLFDPCWRQNRLMDFLFVNVAIDRA